MKTTILLLLCCFSIQAAETNKPPTIKTNLAGIRLSPNQIVWTRLHMREQEIGKRCEELRKRKEKVGERNALQGKNSNTEKDYQSIEAALKTLYAESVKIQAARLDLELKDPNAKREIPKPAKKPAAPKP